MTVDNEGDKMVKCFHDASRFSLCLLFIKLQATLGTKRAYVVWLISKARTFQQ